MSLGAPESPRWTKAQEVCQGAGRRKFQFPYWDPGQIPIWRPGKSPPKAGHRQTILQWYTVEKAKQYFISI